MYSRVDLTLHPSRALALLVLLLWLPALALAAFISARYSGYFLLSLPPLALMAWSEMANQALLSRPSSIIRLRWHGHQLEAESLDGRRWIMTPSIASRIGPRLTLLKLTPSDTTFPANLFRARTVMLLDTSLSRNVASDRFRRLRVVLRLHDAVTG